MPEEKRIQKMPHSLIVENRKKLTLTGVSNVDSFDEQTVVAYTDYGELVLRGKQLQINNLNVETGDLTLEGELESINYLDVQQGTSIFSKLFR